MGELKWTERSILGYLAGLGVATYVVAWNSNWGSLHSGLAVALLAVGFAALAGGTRSGSAAQTSTRRLVALLAILLVISTAGLAGIHLSGDPAWINQLSASPGGDATLWQVQTTFLSVGFAGLAIAAQLFAETPLAIGASRGRVLEHVWADKFVGVGLVANAVIGMETIWFPSDVGTLAVAVFWFLPTLVLLAWSTVRLMQLFSRPSQLDEVVRSALVQTLSRRLDVVSRRYAEARAQLAGLVESGQLVETLDPSAAAVRVQVPHAGLVIKGIKPQAIRRAFAFLAPRATQTGSGVTETAELYTHPQLALDIEPGDRTRIGDTAFRVSTSQRLDNGAQVRLTRLLQLSIEYESPEFVTPDEETDRDIANLKDTIGTSLRAGAFGTAERALELLGQVVRRVWTASPDRLNSSRRSTFTRRDWLFRSIGEVEQDVILSRRAAGLFVDHAMTRALEAHRTGSPEYVDDCLRSFTRLWIDVLRLGDTREFDSLPSRIATCLQSLASFAFSASDQREDFQARATWAIVELVKLALDARRPDAARMAARELKGLFAYSDRNGSGRAHVRAGQLVLSGWLNYLSDKNDDRFPADDELRILVTPDGRWSEILRARGLAERGAAPFSRWDWWEMDTSSSGEAQVLELSHYIDRAQLAALASSYGPLPRAHDQETASAYQRFMRLLGESGRDLERNEIALRNALNEEISRWESAENERLAYEPLSAGRLSALQAKIREDLSPDRRLAAQIPNVEVVPDYVQEPRPILGLNFRVPRHYLVDEIFNQTYADPNDLGRVIARGLIDGEDQRIVRELRSLDVGVASPHAGAIRQRIADLGDEAADFVLVTPYGGFLEDDDWYSIEFREALAKVIHIETSALDGEAILFDRRSALVSCRRPEEKVGLDPVLNTSVAFGVFEDVTGEGEPQVRIEAGEYFVIWRADAPRVFRFGDKPGPLGPDADAGARRV